MRFARTSDLVPYRLTICGLDELEAHGDAEVSHVLSLLDPDTPEPAVGRLFGDVWAHRVLRFHDIDRSMPGGRAPAPDDVSDVLSFGRELRDAPARSHVLVHCHAGVSRSTAAAVILMAQQNPGRETEALAAVTALRPIARPNPRMLALADEILGCQGRLRRLA